VFFTKVRLNEVLVEAFNHYFKQRRFKMLLGGKSARRQVGALRTNQGLERVHSDRNLSWGFFYFTNPSQSFLELATPSHQRLLE
jgi:hypothetical protein